jgi:hypothetical protein
MWTTFGWNLGSVSAGIVIAILTGFYISHRSKPAVGLPIGLIAGLAVFAVIQAAATTLSTASTTSKTDTEGTSSPTTATTSPPTGTSSTEPPPITDPSTPTDTTEPPPKSPSPSTTPPTTQTYYLADVPYTQVEKEGRPGNCTGGCTGFDSGSARIGGNVYPNSWLMQIDGDGRRSTTTWNTVRACTSLDATVGLTDDSPATQITFTATTDQGTEKRATASIGDVNPRHLDLTGGRTLTIAAYVTGNEVDRPDIAWGNLRITCRPGSIETYED